jgi:D-glycerate 3-kinase
MIHSKVDLIVFKGWFLYATPENNDALREPINSLERDQDSYGAWRRYCNNALKNYAPLWQRIDRSVFLQGPGFEQAKHWRWQQEQTLQTANPKRRTMTKAEVENFILLFERISRHVVTHLPSRVNTVLRRDKYRGLL